MEKNFLKEIAIVICGHGSNDENYQKEFDKFTKIIKNKFYNYQVFSCFIEKNSPSIEKCLETIHRFFKKIVFVSALIFQGSHYKFDIKKSIKSLQFLKDEKILFTKNLKLNKNIIDICAITILKKIQSTDDLLITVSSSSDQKNVEQDLREYTQKLSKKLSIKKFFSTTIGKEDELIDFIDNLLKQNSSIKIIVNPIFLFDGFLYQKTKNKFMSKFQNISIIEPFLQNIEIQKIFIKSIKSQIALFK